MPLPRGAAGTDPPLGSYTSIIYNRGLDHEEATATVAVLRCCRCAACHALSRRERGATAREIGQIAGFASALVIVWLSFSRARWLECNAALMLIAFAAIATRPLMHISITGGVIGSY